MKMRKLFTTCVILLLVTMSSATAEVVLEEPVAVVELETAETITQAELEEKYEVYLSNQAEAGRDTSSISRKDVLNVMINDILILQGAAKEGISLSEDQLDRMVSEQRNNFAQQVGTQLTDQQFNQLLTHYFGLTREEYRQKLKENYLVDTYVRRVKGDMIENVQPPTQAEISSFYKRNAANFINPEYVKLGHVFIDTRSRSDSEARKLAEKISRNIRYGIKSFENQVSEYSDDEDSKSSDGEIGWLAIDDESNAEALGEDFMDTAFSLDVGEVSRPVRSQAGYHVIKVLDHRSPKILSMEDTVSPGTDTTVQQYISQQLLQRKQSEAYNQAISAVLEDLREDADIQILLEEE
ncbi:MAG: peptidylprolyl isomerase [Spirochaetota bacterium]